MRYRSRGNPTIGRIILIVINLIYWAFYIHEICTHPLMTGLMAFQMVLRMLIATGLLVFFLMGASFARTAFLVLLFLNLVIAIPVFLQLEAIQGGVNWPFFALYGLHLVVFLIVLYLPSVRAVVNK